MISSPGVGSGLDVNAIISKLMAVESQPLNRLQAEKKTYEAQLSAYGKLKSALSTFQTAMAGLNATSDFKLFTATSSDSTIFTASADSTASTGSYSVQVNSLAAAHKMGSAAFADAGTTVVGNAGDQMKITIGANTLTVNLGQTLNTIRDEINTNAAAAGVGVTASVVQVSSTEFHLALTSNDTGTANAMTTAFVDGTGAAIADPLTMATTVSAADSQVVIDGTYTLTRSSNTITDAIQGVTLNLVKADAANPYTLTIGQDITAVTAKAQAFVDSYNALKKTIGDLRGGDLKGDNTLLSIERQIQNTLNTVPTGITSQYSYLAEIGLSIQKDGTMTLDSTQLDTALQTDFSGVSQLFANDNQGYAFRLQALADSLVQTGGIVSSRTDGINDRITFVDGRIDSTQRRLSMVEQRYRTQFTALDELVARMQTTGNYLTQQLAALPK